MKRVKSQNKVTGNRGEELAALYLEKKGYEIQERNFRTRFGEIDIICRDGQTLVFVEVKTKIGHDFGEPEEMVNKSKLAQVQRMGEVYVNTRTQELENSRNQDSWRGLCRVDVVAIVLKSDGEIEKIEHYQAVY
jgi:putative endonuclease